MKLGIIKKDFLIPAANNVNIAKHANYFYKIGNEVDLLAEIQFLGERMKWKYKDVYKYYDFNRNIKIKYFRGNLFKYFENFTYGYYGISLFLHFHNPAKVFNRFLRKFPIINKYLDPEIMISRYCFKKKYDLIYCRDAFKAAYYNIMNKIPTIIESHHYTIPKELENLFKLSKSAYFKGMVTISDFLRDNLIKNGFPPEKIIVLEDAVDIEKFDQILLSKEKLKMILRLPKNKKIILYMGSLRSDRGLETIFKAAELLKEYNLVFYLFGGQKKHIKIWNNYIKRNKIRAEIKIFTFIPNNLIPYFLKTADILLANYSIRCPSLKWMSPVKIFEYMASKTPIIASKVGRLDDICDNQECVFTTPDDPIDLANKILLVLSNENLRKELTINAYNKAKNHSYFSRCQKILEFSK